MNKDKLIAEATIKGKEFLTDPTVARYLQPFDGKGVVDPVLLWSLERLEKSPEIVIILQDWYLVQGRIGTVQENVDYIEKCYKRQLVEPDGTFTCMFETIWSRALIDSGRCLIFNAARGVRRKGVSNKAAGYLDKAVHEIAMDKLWLWLVGELQPQPKEVWLTRSWADVATAKLAKDRLPNIKKWKLTYHPSSGVYWMNQGNIES
jgi:hypothetical protein